MKCACYLIAIKKESGFGCSFSYCYASSEKVWQTFSSGYRKYKKCSCHSAGIVFIIGDRLKQSEGEADGRVDYI
jgi:hypothetical protein